MRRKQLSREVHIVRKLLDPGASFISTDHICRLFVRRIRATLQSGEPVTLRGLGTFSVATRRIRTGFRGTGDRAERVFVRFRPSPLLLEKPDGCDPV